jgi:hypothetical protein
MDGGAILSSVDFKHDARDSQLRKCRRARRQLVQIQYREKINRFEISVQAGGPHVFAPTIAAIAATPGLWFHRANVRAIQLPASPSEKPL